MSKGRDLETQISLARSSGESSEYRVLDRGIKSWETEERRRGKMDKEMNSGDVLGYASLIASF